MFHIHPKLFSLEVAIPIPKDSHHEMSAENGQNQNAFLQNGSRLGVTRCLGVPRRYSIENGP